MMDQFATPQQESFPPSSLPQSQPTSSPMGQPSPTSEADIPTMLQMNLQITMIALLKLMQNQLTAQTNSFEKTKNIPPISTAITALHTAFHNTEMLSFEKTKPDNSELEAKIKQQDAQHQYALDLMKMHHEEKLAEHKASLDRQKVEHDMKLAEMKAMIEAQHMKQQQTHDQELHEDNLEQNQIQKAQTLQQAQHTEENHQQQMYITEKQSEADLKAKADGGSTSKPE